MQNNQAVVLFAVLIGLLAIAATQSFVTVESGTVGVVTHFGSVQEKALQPGLHYKVPIMTDVIPLVTRVQKVEEESTASSKDLQVIKSKIALNYRIDSSKASTIYSELGPEYRANIVQPALQESIKATSAKYTAEELITKRAEVANEMEEDLVSRLSNKDILPTDLSIIDFNFSEDFNQAIEEKQVAQQAAQRAENELERIEIEAMQVEAEAKGKAQAELARAEAEAKAQELLRQTLTAEVLQLRALERWDGTLPVYMGGGQAAPFLTIPAAPAAR